MICFYEFESREQRVYCANCNNQICANCINNYLSNNAGWCPSCRRHILFTDLKQPDETDNEFNRFVKKCFKYQLKRNRYVQRAPGEPVLNCYNKAKEIQQSPLYRNVNFFEDSETDTDDD
jgi:hypothetical protein